MLLQTTYQDKGTQTDESQESKDIFTILTTLSLQMESMGKRLQQLESQQHDYKNAELSQSEDSKLPEVEGDVGKLQKTHNTVALYTAAGTRKQVSKKPHINVNLNTVFDKPFTSKKPREAMVIAPQTSTYANSLHHNKKVYNHITQTYIENIYKIQTFLNLNPRSTTTTDPTHDYVTQKLQGYNRLIAQPKTKANLVKTCYNYGLLSTVYTHDGEEIIGIPELYKAFVTFKRITKGNLFFIKFYTAPAEILYDEIKPIIQVIKIGITRDMIIPEEIEKQPEIQKMEIPSFYANKRIIGIATIIQELANNYLQGNAIWSYYSRDQLMIYANSKELRQGDMDEVQKWILSLLKPEMQPTTRALKKEFISNELLTRYYKLVGHKYPDHICSKCNGDDNYVPEVQLE
uniref:Putative translocation transactivator/inclusion body protein n=1 Tax=Nicotiana tabacum TaxID=4097 RepID=Q948Y4_TOBAC|nr:putative translocation transactivator/inclusion body protein [Nicotiana tabacum]